MRHRVSHRKWLDARSLLHVIICEVCYGIFLLLFFICIIYDTRYYTAALSVCFKKLSWGSRIIIVLPAAACMYIYYIYTHICGENKLCLICTETVYCTTLPVLICICTYLLVAGWRKKEETSTFLYYILYVHAWHGDNRTRVCFILYIPYEEISFEQRKTLWPRLIAYILCNN